MIIPTPGEDVLAKYNRQKGVKYILSWSGGKDSTAIAILAHLYNLPLDTIIMSEVMFDEVTSGENPEHIKWVYDVAKPKLEEWFGKGCVKILRADSWRTYKSVVMRVVANGKNRGGIWSFPIPGRCMINSELKMRPFRDFRGAIPNRKEYLGYAVGEEKRLAKHLERGKNLGIELYPLIDFGITEPMAKELCQEHGLLSPTYESSTRGGCWFCPNASLKQHARIKKEYPEMWRKLEVIADFLKNYPQRRKYRDRQFCWGKTFAERNAEIDNYLAKEQAQGELFKEEEEC